jgi:hypothetical protein
MHPNEFGRPPDQITEYDTRDLYWPPTGDRRRFWLFKYRYQPQGADGQAHEGIGLVGSTTFALFGEATADLAPEDVYGLHCCWEHPTGTNCGRNVSSWLRLTAAAPQHFVRSLGYCCPDMLAASLSAFDQSRTGWPSSSPSTTFGGATLSRAPSSISAADVEQVLVNPK